MKFSDKTPASEFSQGYKPLTSSGSVLMTIPRVEEVFCPERLSAIRDIKKCSNRLQSQMFSHIVDVLSRCCDHPKPDEQWFAGLGSNYRFFNMT